MQPKELTPRQGEVLTQLLEGRTNKEIARTLNISPFTARAHVAAVMKHFGAARRQDLAVLCSRQARDRFALATDPQIPSMSEPWVRRRWLVGVPACAALAIVAFAGTYDVGPSSAWAVAQMAPEALVLESFAGKANTKIRIDIIATPRISSPDAFLKFSKAHLTTVMVQQRLGLHRFEPLKVDDVACLAYAGVSAPRGAGSANTYTHAKGYLCQHPRRSNAAIRIGAFAEGRTGNFADGDAVRVVLRDLLEKATIS